MSDVFGCSEGMDAGLKNCVIQRLKDELQQVNKA
jgi:hypothetical protein